MDVDQLRAAFAATGEKAEKIRTWWYDRLTKIKEGGVSITMARSSRLALHVISLRQFGAASPMSMEAMNMRATDIKTLSGNGGDIYINIDGIRVVDVDAGIDSRARGYCQLYRGGMIESVWCGFWAWDDGATQIPSVAIEEYIVDSTIKYVELLDCLGIKPPYAIMAALLNVKGARITDDVLRHRIARPIDRSDIIMPDLLLNTTYEKRSDVAKFMRPLLDGIWNACGLVSSSNYDKDGNWIPAMK